MVRPLLRKRPEFQRAIRPATQAGSAFAKPSVDRRESAAPPQGPVHSPAHSASTKGFLVAASVGKGERCEPVAEVVGLWLCVITSQTLTSPATHTSAVSLVAAVLIAPGRPVAGLIAARGRFVLATIARAVFVRRPMRFVETSVVEGEVRHE